MDLDLNEWRKHKNYVHGSPHLPKMFIYDSLPDADTEPQLPDYNPAIELVCKKINQPAYQIDQEGFQVDIYAAAVEGDRLAWMTCRSKYENPSDWMDVSFRLLMMFGDELVLDWEPYTYNPYDGCVVRYMQWWGNILVLVYDEKHDSLLYSITDKDNIQKVEVTYNWRLQANALQCLDFEGNREAVYRLPDLEKLH